MSVILDKLSHLGFEVESVRKRELNTQFLKVAQILESKKHPNADRLSLCRVKTQDEEYRVVCGAKNYQEGDKVILALPGAELAQGLKIKESTIRGEASQGMLCSQTELGFLDSSEGILILPKEVSLTDDIRKILGLGNTLFELNITPNRPDCLSFMGIARELSSAFGKKVLYPKTNIKESKTEKIQKRIKIYVKASKECPRYMARLIQGVKIGPSPTWLKEALESVGLRSINNVVDVTNFVLMEWGQPLHAFDVDKIEGGVVVIRKASSGEKMITLDGGEYLLTPQDLVISDLKKPIALAGIMGGVTSEVSETAVNILLESAYFNPTTIRKTSKRLGLSSESSKRFERGVDIEGVEKALHRAADLITQISGGSIAQGYSDIYPKKFLKKRIALSLKRLEQYLGYKVSSKTVKETLGKLGFSCISLNQQRGIFQVPSFRYADISCDVDLIEEIARSQGYNKIPAQELSGQSFLDKSIERKNALAPKIKSLLVSSGLTEIVNLSFCSPQDLKKIGYADDVLKIQNPLGEENSIMRPSLVPSLLKTCLYNLHHGEERVRLFELRHTYDAKGKETPWLGGLLCGTRLPTQWAISPKEIDFYDLKAVMVLLLEGLHFDKEVQFLKKEGSRAYLHPVWFLEIWIKGCLVGYFGKLHPKTQEAFDIEKNVFIFEMNVDLLEHLKPQAIHCASLPKFPSVKRDLSILISEEMSYEKVYEVIQKESGGIVKGISLFDVYRGEPIPKGYKSFAFSLVYQSLERTLTDQEVNTAHDTVCKALVKDCQAQIR